MEITTDVEGKRPEEREEGPDDNVKCCKIMRTHGMSGWCRKFFWEGQLHNKAHEADLARLSTEPALPRSKRFLIQHRRTLGFILPGIFVHIFWWALFIKKDLWYLFPTKYPMSITMIFGSLIAGMTSEGGGAVAFPVMTLVLQITPEVARDFSMMIQACGMTCAAASIFFMRIQLEWSSILFCSLGSWVGMVLGFHVIDPRMTPPQKKMFFVSIWFAFAFMLFLLNRLRKRRTFPRVPMMNWWKVLVLLATGCLGGIFTSFAGSGLDICSFCILTLLFRVSEKVATPTSVVLMAGASIFGFYWRAVMMDEGPSDLAYEYMAVCVPIVVIGAPCGALLGSHFHRLVLATFVYVLDTAVLVTAFVLVDQTALLTGVSVAIIVGGFIFFLLITFAGQKLLDYIERYEEKNKDEFSVPPATDTATAEGGHVNRAASIEDEKGASVHL